MKQVYQFFSVFCILWTVFVSACQNENSQFNSKNETSSKFTFSENILTQRNNERKFSSTTLKMIREINFEYLEKPPYRPTYLRVDEKGALYTVDFSEFYIHKFSPSSNWKYFRHSFFGKGKGQGPGELSRVLDFKIFKDELYLADEGTGSIEVYSIDGTYKKRIILGNHLMPKKITIQNDRIIVESSTLSDPIFFVYDMSGNMLFSFGKLIDETSRENSVYQDNELSDSFYGNYFYYLPRFLGFVGLYKGDNLIMAKETIDGVEKGKKNVPVEKAVMKGITAKTVNKKYETVLLHALHKDFLLIKAYDYENETSFWDIYNLSDFNYMMSIKKPPVSQYFVIYKNYLAVLAEEEMNSKIRIFDLTKVLEEIKGKTFPKEKSFYSSLLPTKN